MRQSSRWFASAPVRHSWPSTWPGGPATPSTRPDFRAGRRAPSPESTFEEEEDDDADDAEPAAADGQATAGKAEHRASTPDVLHLGGVEARAVAKADHRIWKRTHGGRDRVRGPARSGLGETLGEPGILGAEAIDLRPVDRERDAVGQRPHTSGAYAVLGDERPLPDDGSRPELALALWRLDEHAALHDDEEAGTGLPVLDQHLPGGELHPRAGRFEPLQIVLVHAREYRTDVASYLAPILWAWSSRSSTAPSQTGTTDGPRVSRPS